MCAEHTFTNRTARAGGQRGLSIIELMVGIVVAMLVGLAATSSAVMFTASQRQGYGVGGASISAATALGSIKSDAALAGLGYFSDALALCSSLNISKGAAVRSDGAAFAPLQATRDGDHDILNLTYASMVQAGTNAFTAKPSDGTSVELRAYLPAAVGNAVLLAPESGGLCTLRSVTAVTPSTALTSQVLSFDNSGANSTHNQAAFATAGSYPSRSRVSLLGEMRWNRYRVTGGNLVMERPMDGSSVVLVRNVIAFRVQYGVSATAAAADTTLDSWVDATGTYASLSAANIDFVRAVRIAVLVRSPQREKPDNAGNCSATDTAPQVFGTTPTAFTGADTSWRCFRHRTSTVVVPLRNFVM
jgi:type IV pilus assembly protein PilW